MKKFLIFLLVGLSMAVTAQASIPTMKGTDHIGITVPNLSQAVSFFVDVIGCEAFYQLGPFADPKGKWMQENLNVHPRAKIQKMQLVRCGNGSNLELFEYESPDQDKSLVKNSDIGGHHVAFYVDDIEKAVSYLKSNDISVQGDIHMMDSGPSAGESWVYFTSPWGMQLELVSYPQGKAYEKNSKSRLFSPKN